MRNYYLNVCLAYLKMLEINLAKFYSKNCFNVISTKIVD